MKKIKILQFNAFLFLKKKAVKTILSVTNIILNQPTSHFPKILIKLNKIGKPIKFQATKSATLKKYSFRNSIRVKVEQTDKIIRIKKQSEH